MAPEHNLSPDNSSFSDELRSLRVKRAKQLDGLKRIDAGIARLEELELRPAAESSMLPAITKDQYKGWKLMAAVKDYLLNRKGHHIPLPRVVEDMVIAGTDPGGERQKGAPIAKTMMQNLRIALAQTPKRPFYEINPTGKIKGIPADEITIWLASLAEEELRKSKK